MNVSNNIQYPPQTGFYKVFVKDKGTWQGHNVARLQISVGNPKHDGDKFFALAEWAAARFDHVILIVSDTLQKHNIGIQRGVNLDAAYRQSLHMGDEWLARNKAAIDILSNKTVTRWDDWLNHADYQNTYMAISTLYNQREDVKTAIDNKAREFAIRHVGHDDNNPALQEMTKIAARYIIEELAAFAIMFREPRAVDVYPGSWFQEIFDVLAQYDGIPAIESFKTAECLRVDFVRNKGYAEILPRMAA